MKKSLITLVVATMLTPLFAQANSTDFSPMWRASLGLTATSMRDFEYNDINIDAPTDILSNSVVSAAIEYQWSEQWSASFQVMPQLDNCHYFCGGHQVDQQNNLIDLNYKVNFYNLEALYHHKISKRWNLILSGGAVIGKEKFVSITCDQYKKGFFGRYCASESSKIQTSSSETKYGLIAGLAMQFQFSEHWGLKFDIKTSNYRQGLNQSSFSMSYRF